MHTAGRQHLSTGGGRASKSPSGVEATADSSSSGVTSSPTARPTRIPLPTSPTTTRSSPRPTWTPGHGIQFAKQASPTPSPLKKAKAPAYHSIRQDRRQYSTFTYEDRSLKQALQNPALPTASVAYPKLDRHQGRQDATTDTAQSNARQWQANDAAPPPQTAASVPSAPTDAEPEAASSREDQTDEQDDDGVALPDPLPFQIPLEVFEQAVASQESENPTQWTHDLYKDSTGGSVKIHYCKRLADVEIVAQHFLDEPFLGFDIEWASDPFVKRNIKNSVSVVQLASPTRIAIFHIALHEGDTIDKLLAPSLKKIMESPTIIKTGVAIKGDCTRCRTHLNIESRSIFELSHLHKLVKYSADAPKLVNRKSVALKDLVLENLGLPLAKGAVRTSAWDRPLNLEQLRYAAADAYAAVILFDDLERKRLQMKPCPPRPEMAETNLPIKLATTLFKVDVVESGSEEDSELDSESDLEVRTEAGDQAFDALESLSEEMSALKVAEAQIEVATAMSNSTESLPASVVEPPIAKAVTKPQKPAASAKPPPKAAVKPQLPTAPESAEMQQANAWVTAYTEARPAASTSAAQPGPYRQFAPQRATPAHLRAYSMWYHQQLSLQDTAIKLRDPPLKTSTVALYVLQAVHCERLPFDEGRLRACAKNAGFVPVVLRMSKVVGPFVRNN